jgi:AcrR family transcriptional regulator
MFLHVIRQSETPDVSCLPGGRWQNRARILDAAGRLLRERSLDALGMDEIARAAGLTRRTLYNHFASTAEIFRMSRQTLLAELVPLVPQAVADSAPAAIALTRFAFQAVRLFGDPRHADLYVSVAREGHAQPWIAQSYETRIQAPMIAAISTCLTEMRRSDGFHGDIRAAAFQLLWTLQAAAASQVISGQAVSAEAIVNAFLVQHRPESAIAA